MRDRAISSKFLTHRVSKECNLCNFQKNFPSPKMAVIFEFLPKMAKHKFASISLTVRDRAISSKFSTHGVSKKCTLGNFQKIFHSPHVAAIFFCEFWPKMEKHKFALTVQNRVISVKLCNFQKNFPSPKMAAILNFRIFAKTV